MTTKKTTGRMYSKTIDKEKRKYLVYPLDLEFGLNALEDATGLDRDVLLKKVGLSMDKFIKTAKKQTHFGVRDVFAGWEEDK